MKDPRICAAQAVERIVYRGQQLNRTLDRVLPDHKPADQRFLAELVNGVVRWFWLLDGYAGLLVERPLKRKHRDVHCLLLTGLYQLEFTRVPVYACVNETVQAVKGMGKSWTGPFLNAVMREFIKNRDQHRQHGEFDDAVRYSHPSWLVERLKMQWPGHWSKILDANNSKPEMILRVNDKQCSVADYLDTLAAHGIEAVADHVSPVGVRLGARIPVGKLPGFGEGVVSVQNSASQLVAPLMDIESGHRVLDACSAPGGKLMHMLDMVPQTVDFTAVDIDESRCSEIRENLQRVGRSATVLAADATQPESWWDGRPFDRIVLDVPCSATGIISKHPDIKHHRKPEDVEHMMDVQQKLIDAMLGLLGENGKLVYTTCSVLAQENEQQVVSALQRHPEFAVEPLPSYLGRWTGHGRQRLQGVDSGDGFFYAALVRH